MERIGLSPGSEVGGYRILAPLGAGGMGAVYRAADGGGAEVALKLLHPHIGADPAARERLRREVSALQRLRHPAVAAVLDAEADSTEAFIVTELIDGESLTDHTRARGPLPPEDVVDLAAGLLSALEAVHNAGVIHRDLKPSNVILTGAGPVLIDFGIAQGMDDARLTSTGVVLGTPGYLAPELLDGAEPDEASDWWGWAAVLAFAATGREPFGARPVEAVLARARAGEIDLAHLPPPTARALSRALAPRPSDRPSPHAVLAELEDALRAASSEEGRATLLLSGPAPVAGRPSGVPPHPFGEDAPPRDGRTRAFGDVHPGGGGPADDGQTQAFADAPPLAGEGPSHLGTAFDDVRSGDPFADDDVTDLLADDAEGYAPPVPVRRTATVFFLLLLALAFAPLAPGVVLGCVGAATLVFGTADSAASALEARRERRGIRRGDGFRTVVTWPWHVLRSAAIALPSMLVAASVVVVVGGVAWWLLDTNRLTLATDAPRVYSAVIALAVLAGLVTLWFGPFARATRVGARRTLERLAPGRVGAMVLIALAVVGIAVAAVLIATGEPTWWWPLPGPPSLA